MDGFFNPDITGDLDACSFGEMAEEIRGLWERMQESKGWNWSIKSSLQTSSYWEEQRTDVKLDYEVFPWRY